MLKLSNELPTCLNNEEGYHGDDYKISTLVEIITCTKGFIELANAPLCALTTVCGYVYFDLKHVTLALSIM